MTLEQQVPVHFVLMNPDLRFVLIALRADGSGSALRADESGSALRADGSGSALRTDGSGSSLCTDRTALRAGRHGSEAGAMIGSRSGAGDPSKGGRSSSNPDLVSSVGDLEAVGIPADDV